MAPDVFNMRIRLGASVALLWAAQLAFVWLRRRSGLGSRSLEPSRTACLVAIGAAWAVRSALDTVLFARGFAFFWIDDPIRFGEAFEWSRHPSFLGGGVWLPGTQYLHGSAMALAKDPLTATRAAAATANLAALIGLFAYAQGLFRNRLLSCMAVLCAGPWWLQTLLGTGALAEVPMTAFMLGGAGLLLLSVDEPETATRRAKLAVSAALFALGTAFHVVAWTALAIVLVASIGAFFVRRDRAFALSAKELAAHVAGSSAFSVAYVVSSQIRYGEPLHFMREQAILERTNEAVAPWLVHPIAVVFSCLELAPLVLLGIVASASRPNPRRAWALAVLVALLLSLLALCVAAELYGTTPTPYRATLLATTALIPFAMHPLSSGPPGAATPSDAARPRAMLAASIVLFAVWVGVNVRESLERRTLEASYRGALGTMQLDQPSARALGSFIRQNAESARGAAADAWKPPIRLLFLRTGWDSWLGWLSIAYVAGNPGWFEPSSWHPFTRRFDAAEIDAVKPKQLVLTDTDLVDGRFAPVVSFAPYRLYERRAP